MATTEQCIHVRRATSFTNSDPLVIHPLDVSIGRLAIKHPHRFRKIGSMGIGQHLSKDFVRFVMNHNIGFCDAVFTAVSYTHLTLPTNREV